MRVRSGGVRRVKGATAPSFGMPSYAAHALVMTRRNATAQVSHSSARSVFNSATGWGLPMVADGTANAEVALRRAASSRSA